MERYFTKVAKTSTSTSKKPRYHPYNRQPLPSEKESTDEGSMNRKPTVKELNKGLLRGLKNEHNPITHSDIGERADRVVSVSTGHQVAEERQNRKQYLQDREKKLTVQRASNLSTSGVFRSVRIYLSGYLNDTTDIEMKRVIVEGGGQTVMLLSQCTHIVTSQWMSGSKTHRLLTRKARNNPYVVRPEWVFESIAKGKRQPERTYAISMDKSHQSLEM